MPEVVCCTAELDAENGAAHSGPDRLKNRFLIEKSTCRKLDFERWFRKRKDPSVGIWDKFFPNTWSYGINLLTKTNNAADATSPCKGGPGAC